MYKRSHYGIVLNRIVEPRRFIQVLAGPRQVGKSTLINQIISELTIPNTLAVADDIPASDTNWIAAIWETVRSKRDFRCVIHAGHRKK